MGLLLCSTLFPSCAAAPAAIHPAIASAAMNFLSFGRVIMLIAPLRSLGRTPFQGNSPGGLQSDPLIGRMLAQEFREAQATTSDTTPIPGKSRHKTPFRLVMT